MNELNETTNTQDKISEFSELLNEEEPNNSNAKKIKRIVLLIGLPILAIVIIFPCSPKYT